MGFLVVAGLWMVLSGFIFCVPVPIFWSMNKSLVAAHCLPKAPVWFTNASIQIITDIIILILPMPIVSKLRLPKRQRAGIMIIFGVGVCVIATSLARVYELSVMVRSHDFTSKLLPIASIALLSFQSSNRNNQLTHSQRPTPKPQSGLPSKQMSL